MRSYLQSSEQTSFADESNSAKCQRQLCSICVLSADVNHVEATWDFDRRLVGQPEQHNQRRQDQQ
jgi:hypothetical protein